MNEERKDEIGRRFLLTPEISQEELGGLEIQELIFLVHAAKRFKAEEAFPDVYLDERIKGFTGVLYEKIKNADALYLAYDRATGYPYVDGEDRVWMFSQEDVCRERGGLFSAAAFNAGDETDRRGGCAEDVRAASYPGADEDPR